MQDTIVKFINEQIEKKNNPIDKGLDFDLFLYNKYLEHKELLKLFIEKHAPSINQQDFVRAVSLYKISLYIKKIKGFPKIEKLYYDSSDHIVFEPVLNLNLLKLNLEFLKRTSASLDKKGCSTSADLKIIIESEIGHLQDRITKIQYELKETPAILIKELGSFGRSDPTRKPKISIITASYNLASMVEETMRSVANQDYADFEHIVIDGASSDNSVDLIKKYPNIKLISEKDTGYPDAFWKGLNMAQGEYILQCAISDGYATPLWLNKAISVLDNNEDVSLVWGFAGRLTEESKFTAVSRSQFHYIEAPQREAMFNYWLKTFFVYPEGNLCVRKAVILKCYPSVYECAKDNILDWLEFSYRFNRLGYISTHIPILANFGRSHGNQLGEQLGNAGSLKGKYFDYYKKIKTYRTQILLNKKQHIFINSNATEIGTKFDNEAFMKEYVHFKIRGLFKIHPKYFKLQNYSKYFRKYLKNISKKHS